MAPRSQRWSTSNIVRRTGLVGSLGLIMVALSGCTTEEVLRFGWPSGVTPESHNMLSLWTWSVVAALVMGVIVWGLTFWTVIFHRKRKDSPEFPRQTGYNVPLELLYTAVPFVIIAVLFYFTILVQNDVESQEADPDVVVDVTAFQWNWKFGYQIIDLKAGEPKYIGLDQDRKDALRSAPEGIDEHGHELVGAINGENPADLSYLNPDKIETVGSSDEIPVLVLPVNKRIEFQLASSDVVHSFRVPEFLFTRDVMPNPEQNHADNVFQISEIEREGAFVGRCAEMCGTYHSMMNFEVRAVSVEKFKKYIEARKNGMTNAQALESIGEQGTSIKTIPFDTRRTAREAVNADGK
ncbi:MAG: aa3-type cytochrome oxidase subunit II [Mycobacteriaceae bacterium]